MFDQTRASTSQTFNAPGGHLSSTSPSALPLPNHQAVPDALQKEKQFYLNSQRQLHDQQHRQEEDERLAQIKKHQEEEQERARREQERREQEEAMQREREE